MPDGENERSSTGAAIVKGVAISIIAGGIGFLLSFVNGLRTDSLSFTNEQIERLYGPLYALTRANRIAFDNYVESGRAPHWEKQVDASTVKLWRTWMPQVLQPINIATEKAIFENSQLIVGDEFYGVFSKFIAHTEGYRALIARWDQSDSEDFIEYTNRDNNTVKPPYPDRITECVGSIYTQLKARQSAMRSDLLFWYLHSTVRIPDSCEVTEKPKLTSVEGAPTIPRQVKSSLLPG